MPDAVTVIVDDSEIRAGVAQFLSALDRELEVASRETADAIAREARARVRRRTGRTAESIRVERLGAGYVVLAGGAGQYLEKGTKFMEARPFFDASARLEEGRYVQRADTAIADSLDESGLGD